MSTESGRSRVATRLRRRKPKGGGTCYRRKDGLWVAEITRDGQRLRRTAATEALAKGRLAKAVGTLPAARGNLSDPTVGEWVTYWIANQPGLRDLTRVNYGRIARNHIIPTIGTVKLRDLNIPKVRNMLADLRASGLGPGTCRNVRNVLSGACRIAVEDDTIPSNPAHIEVPGAADRSVVRVSTKDVVRMLNAIEDHKMRDLWALQLYCGLRLGEALGLDWSDVRIAEGTIQVRRTDTRILGADGQLTRGFGKPKTDASERIVPIPQEAKDLLWPRKHRMGEPEHGLVFPSVRDPLKPIGPSYALAQFKRVMGAAGFDPIPTQHDLRHWCATILLGRGVPVAVVSKILGHKTPAVTRKVYAHVLTESEKLHSEAMTFFLPKGSRPPRRVTKALEAAAASSTVGGKKTAHTPHPRGLSDRPHRAQPDQIKHE